jgi:hypothetical protein
VEWIVKILSFFKSKQEEQRLNEIKLIIDEVKELRDYHKSDAKEQKLINEKLFREHAEMKRELLELRKNWGQCLKQWRELKDDYTVTFQKLIFKTKGKWKDDDIEPK